MHIAGDLSEIADICTVDVLVAINWMLPGARQQSSDSKSAPQTLRLVGRQEHLAKLKF